MTDNHTAVTKDGVQTESNEESDNNQNEALSYLETLWGAEDQEEKERARFDEQQNTIVHRKPLSGIASAQEARATPQQLSNTGVMALAARSSFRRSSSNGLGAPTAAAKAPPSSSIFEQEEEKAEAKRQRELLSLVLDEEEYDSCFKGKGDGSCLNIAVGVAAASASSSDGKTSRQDEDDGDKKMAARDLEKGEEYQENASCLKGYDSRLNVAVGVAAASASSSEGKTRRQGEDGGDMKMAARDLESGEEYQENASSHESAEKSRAGVNMPAVGIAVEKSEDNHAAVEPTRRIRPPRSMPGAFNVVPTFLRSTQSPPPLVVLRQSATQVTVHSSSLCFEDGSSDDQLVVATAVTDDPQDFPQAERIDVKSEGQNAPPRAAAPFTRRWIMVLVVMACIAGLVSAGLLSSRDIHKKEVEVAQGPTSINATEAEVSLTDVVNVVLQRLKLPNYTLASIVNDRQSAQSRALRWVLQDPFLEEYSDDRLVQRFALAAVYFSTGGDNWLNNTNWIGRSKDDYRVHECDYYAQDYLFRSHDGTAFYPRVVDHCNNGGLLQQLLLHKNGLQGTIPPELYLLTSLQMIKLYGNSLEGTISSHVGDLTDLYGIALLNNDLSGSLPTELGRMTRLDFLGTFANPRLEGTVPTELGGLTNLEWLIIDSCSLTGTVPSELGLLSKLRHFHLQSNKLTGTIPAELGGLHDLVGLNLYENSLTGTIPTALGRLSNLFWLFLEHNGLSGTIPSELGALPEMETLSLHSNRLSGSIPSTLGELTKLSILDVHANAWLSGTIASEIGNLGNFRLTNQFHVEDTGLSGTIPLELCTAESLAFDCSALLCGCDCPCI